MPEPPAQQRLRKARYREAGLCTRCGGKRDRDDRVTCERCREIKRREQLMRRNPELELPLLDLPPTERPVQQPQPKRMCVRCRADHPDMDDRLCIGCRDLVEPTDGCAHRWEVGLPVFEREDGEHYELTYGKCARCGGQRTWALKDPRSWRRWSLKGQDDD